MGKGGGMGTTREEAIEADVLLWCPCCQQRYICVSANSKIWASTPSIISDGSSHAN